MWTCIFHIISSQLLTNLHVFTVISVLPKLESFECHGSPKTGQCVRLPAGQKALLESLVLTVNSLDMNLTSYLALLDNIHCAKASRNILSGQYIFLSRTLRDSLRKRS